jgi:hypothetical protein
MPRNDDLNENNLFNIRNNYDNNEYYVEYDTDGSADDDMDEYEHDNFYEPDEPSRTRFNIILCEIYNRNIHGVPYAESAVDTHYLVSSKFKNIDINLINEISDYMKAEYLNLNREFRKHKNIRNYHNIITRPNYIKPEIAECIYLPHDECVAILKTFWIRIIQRNWKRILKERQQIVKERNSIQYLMKREICANKRTYWPCLKGMLSNIL